MSGSDPKLVLLLKSIRWQASSYRVWRERTEPCRSWLAREGVSTVNAFFSSA